MQSSQLAEFRQKINQYYRDLQLGDQTTYRQAQADLQLDSFEGLDETLLALLEQLEPYGNSHEPPLFAAPVTITDWRAVGAQKNHAKVQFVDVNGVQRDGIGFGLAEVLEKIDKRCQAYFYLERNEWNGRVSLQHRIVDLRP